MTIRFVPRTNRPKTGRIAARQRLRSPAAIELPRMIEIKDCCGRNISIMESEVTVRLFREVMRGYVFEGFGAEKPRALLNDRSQLANPMTCVNLGDVQEFARRLSELTGRAFRLPTSQEVAAAKGELMGQMPVWTKSLKSYIKDDCGRPTLEKGYYDDIVVIASASKEREFDEGIINRSPRIYIRLVEEIEEIAA